MITDAERKDIVINTVSIDASTHYDIHIGPGVMTKLVPSVRELKQVQKICIVSDNNVFPLYGALVHTMLENSGYRTTDFVFPSGEEHKNADTYLALLAHLAKHQFTRSDLLIALGGGVVGDLTGFAAATYLRGIRYIQIPTTLLAAVDSSVGGKTAIDLPSGKNLVGAFHQPSLVLCDTDVLNTLPEDVFRDGCAEVIKYAILYDPELFAHLEHHIHVFSRSSVITQCIRWKRDAVVADEFDRGIRKKLNLGHTVGHAVEVTSGYSVSHGCAVSIGMAIIARGAVRMGLCSQEACDRITALLEAFGLPTFTTIAPQKLLQAMLADKKRNSETIDLIIPNKIGDCSISTVSIDRLPEIITAGI